MGIKTIISVALVALTLGCAGTDKHVTERAENTADGVAYTAGLQDCLDAAVTAYINGEHVPTINADYKKCHDVLDIKHGRK